MRRRFLAYGTVGIFTVLFGSLIFLGGSTGCYGDQCTGTVGEFGLNAGEGRLLDPNTWESNLQSSEWLSYSHQRSWFIRVKGFEGRDISQVFVYISPDKDPNVFQQGTYKQYTLASGNLAEITIAENGRPGVTPLVQVHNDTCADYYTRIVVEAYPALPDAGTPDTADTGTNQDAASDTGATE
ncbi:hypothetical protein LZC95_35660 [Pendulispora brunnea]|uniref:Secreted protein n=1 Tax=Pendulispora brunnea TaxID=2905690 RepID=A0ABZ2K3R6_9BACT